MTEREPDIRDDPRRQDVGEGYPETNPEGTSPAQDAEQGPEAATGETPEPDIDASLKKDAPPSRATGNPGAAGP